MLISDVSRAFFEAPMRRKVVVELPSEAYDAEDEGEDLVGVLEMSLYGTRDAAANFQNEVAKLMKVLGYTQAVYNASLYRHERHGISVLVHGDDFVAVGGREKGRGLQAAAWQEVYGQNKVIGSGHGGGELQET